MSHASELNLKIEAHVHIDSTETFTTAVIEVSQPSTQEFYGGIGTAKRNAGDKYNEEVGVTLAVSRALRDVADEIEAAAHRFDGTHRG